MTELENKKAFIEKCRRRNADVDFIEAKSTELDVYARGQAVAIDRLMDESFDLLCDVRGINIRHGITQVQVDLESVDLSLQAS